MKNLVKKITTKTNEMAKKAGAKISANEKVQKIKIMGTTLWISLATMPMRAYAATDAEAAWADTVNAIQPWVTRLGVVLLVFGGIEFAVAQQNEDAAQKTRSGRFMISGAAAIGVAEALFPLLL